MKEDLCCLAPTDSTWYYSLYEQEFSSMRLWLGAHGSAHTQSVTAGKCLDIYWMGVKVLVVITAD